MRRKVGERVGAILGRDETELQFIGFGTYQGEKPLPPKPDGPVGTIAEAVRAVGMPNPCIALDGGGVVWGCECWWGSEHKVRRQLNAAAQLGIRITKINMPEFRSQFVAEAEVQSEAS